MKWYASEWEAELTIPGGDKSPIILCIWIRTKIEFVKLDYNYYQLSNYIFDPDYLCTFFLKAWFGSTSSIFDWESLSWPYISELSYAFWSHFCKLHLWYGR